MLNKIVIVGRMTKDAQIYEKEDNKIATFCVATEKETTKMILMKFLQIIYFVKLSVKLPIILKSTLVKVL